MCAKPNAYRESFRKIVDCYRDDEEPNLAKRRIVRPLSPHSKMLMWECLVEPGHTSHSRQNAQNSNAGWNGARTKLFSCGINGRDDQRKERSRKHDTRRKPKRHVAHCATRRLPKEHRNCTDGSHQARNEASQETQH